MNIDLKRLSKTRIMVIGDVMLDRYIWGEVSRISPEAPVPVVRIRKRSETPGGAGNVAANLSGLECRVTLLGVCGMDAMGERLESILRSRKIETRLIPDDHRPTITKTRIMAQGQQLFRLDEEEPDALGEKTVTALWDFFREKIETVDGVILSDYGKGIFKTEKLCQDMIRECRKRMIPVIVDPKGTDWARYGGATCITPNTAELELAVGKQFEENESDLIDAARILRHHLEIDHLLVTRGAKGMILIQSDDESIRIPARAREVFDVSGAGDTVIATLTAGLALGLSFVDASRLANMAAGVVVGKLGTQPVLQAELMDTLRYADQVQPDCCAGKIASLDAAQIQIKAWQTAGNRIVFTNGCYDLLHPGHIHLLNQSRMLGDRLVVGLNTDASVRRLKGDSRPIVTERDRAAILGALSSVDMVVLFDEDTPLLLIAALQPDILVKGNDYRLDQVVGRDVVEAYGGQVCLVPLLQGYSTTGIVERMKDKGLS
ncbi:MAG: bifunctional D-glycero-beta-D-manno-heptose-7-phosphate kinase/D-glycero-beta-D-manno-heptose 1-phosphate adenylyltransferase HldE [Desulfatirhabdiaceae bacterium]